MKKPRTFKERKMIVSSNSSSFKICKLFSHFKDMSGMKTKRSGGIGEKTTH